jgi:hypothetical protein
MSITEDTTQSEEFLGEQGSLRHLVDESFLTLENNINDIIAFEEESAQKQTAFRQARALFATPSERAIARMPSERALGELKQLTTHFEMSTHFETGDVSDLQLELERATSEYEVFGENPFGIGTKSTKPKKAKRISFSGDSVADSPRPSMDGETLRVAIKARLDFFESTLAEYSKERLSNVSSIDADTEKELNALYDEQHLTPKETLGENEFYTPDTSLREEDSDDDKEKEEEVKMRSAKEAVYSSAGKSTQQGSRKIPDPLEEMKTKQKRKFGERFKNLVKRVMGWMRKRAEAFVASFAPKDKLIVVTEMD